MTNNQIRIEDIMQEIQPVDELDFERVDHRYRSVQLILTGLGYTFAAVLALLLLLTDASIWCILVECVIAVTMVVNLIIANKAWKFKGYALRDNDITYRSGLLFAKTTTIPFNRLQQVSVKQNPVSKIFSMYSVEVFNGAQGMASLTIPGLREERANQIKDILIQKLKNDD
ncbi:MAG: PH domain-containing protein [Muribaculaceae bacterium]|nr:PH domain-containing protein [Muribaculaceae bacterium]